MWRSAKQALAGGALLTAGMALQPAGPAAAQEDQPGTSSIGSSAGLESTTGAAIVRLWISCASGVLQVSQVVDGRVISGRAEVSSPCDGRAHFVRVPVFAQTVDGYGPQARFSAGQAFVTHRRFSCYSSGPDMECTALTSDRAVTIEAVRPSEARARAGSVTGGLSARARLRQDGTVVVPIDYTCRSGTQASLAEVRVAAGNGGWTHLSAGLPLVCDGIGRQDRVVLPATAEHLPPLQGRSLVVVRLICAACELNTWFRSVDLVPAEAT